MPLVGLTAITTESFKTESSCTNGNNWKCMALKCIRHKGMEYGTRQKVPREKAKRLGKTVVESFVALLFTNYSKKVRNKWFMNRIYKKSQTISKRKDLELN
jgi:hypothetical protein